LVLVDDSLNMLSLPLIRINQLLVVLKVNCQPQIRRSSENGRNYHINLPVIVLGFSTLVMDCPTNVIYTFLYSRTVW